MTEYWDYFFTFISYIYSVVCGANRPLYGFGEGHGPKCPPPPLDPPVMWGHHHRHQAMATPKGWSGGNAPSRRYGSALEKPVCVAFNTRTGGGGAKNALPSGFSQIAEKRRRGAPPFFQYLLTIELDTLCDNFNPRSTKVRSPGQVKVKNGFLGVGWPGGLRRLYQQPLSEWLRVQAPSLPGHAALPPPPGVIGDTMIDDMWNCIYGCMWKYTGHMGGK